eukprot:5787228-Karenia_brevis.AAC.1
MICLMCPKSINLSWTSNTLQSRCGFRGKGKARVGRGVGMSFCDPAWRTTPLSTYCMMLLRGWPELMFQG